MSLGLIGTKVGMTRVFTEAGTAKPVTVVYIPPNRVMQTKNVESDGYNALQVTAGARKRSAINKPLAGHARKAGILPGQSIREFRIKAAESRPLGTELDVGLFTVGHRVNVSGTSKGKGFAGTVKRHNFSMQDASHGNSLAHRVPGSIGQCQLPGRVFKGKKMAGQMGNKRVTIKNLEIIKVDKERCLLLIGGAVPGSPGSEVTVTCLQVLEYDSSSAEPAGSEQASDNASSQAQDENEATTATAQNKTPLPVAGEDH